MIKLFRAQAMVWLLVFGAACLAAQQPAPGQNERPSLGEVARKARAEKAGQPKARRVFDDQSIGQETPVSSGKPSGQPPDDPKSTAAKPAAPKSSASLETEYRAAFSKLREQLKAAEAKSKPLADKMAKFSPNSATVVHYYYDPVALKAIQDQIDANNKRIADLKQRIADLEEELHRKGLPSGWAN